MIRRPPRSTLFPYNDALPISAPRRRSSRRPPRRPSCTTPGSSRARPFSSGPIHPPRLRHRAPALARSEEHTSELQSQSNLVCRLLLEKKKIQIGGTVGNATLL